MKLDELLEHARHVVATYDRERFKPAVDLAQGIIDMLGELPPCGLGVPSIIHDPNFEGLYLDTDGLIAIEDGRAFAAMVIRQVEAAEDRNKS